MLKELDGAKKAGLSDSTLSSINASVENISRWSQKWKNSFAGMLHQTRSQIIDYDDTFDSLYTEIQQQIQRGNKQQVLQLLQTLQKNLFERKKNTRDFITSVEVFKSEMVEYARNIANDLKPIHSRMEAYRKEIQGIVAAVSSMSLSEADRRKIIAEATREPSVLLYNILGPLYDHLTRLMQEVQGINDDRLSISWQVSLDDILVTWNSLDSMLSSVIDQVEHASQLNTEFMQGRLQAVHNLWKSEIIEKLKM
ncbi:HBL/NHE enterotoxin family protein [Bacillus toyonensis]|uniref:Uncharacterized protein n=1 Tax=Bacillus toyonensis TaxID=155322 RepID=A0A2A8H000_9BACI|nr:HBL/NHE enterotoxin family protein [Bacillus toyonensis]PEP85133.1 hypothetical protein CN585_30630 [Bacillus toyonensis]